jgi:hypothetical protein
MIATCGWITTRCRTFNDCHLRTKASTRAAREQLGELDRPTEGRRQAWTCPARYLHWAAESRRDGSQSWLSMEVFGCESAPGVDHRVSQHAFISRRPRPRSASFITGDLCQGIYLFHPTHDLDGHRCARFISAYDVCYTYFFTFAVTSATVNRIQRIENE